MPKNNMLKLIAMTFFNICFSSWVIVLLGSLLLAAWVCCVSFIISPLLGVIGLFFPITLLGFSSGLLQMLISVVLSIIGSVLLYYLIKLTRKSYQKMLEYIYWCKQAVKDE